MKSNKIFVMNYKYFLKKIKCLTCITLISVSWCFGQSNNKTENDYAWVNLGIGFSAVTGSLGGSVGINCSYLKKHSIVSLRFVHSTELDLWGWGNAPTDADSNGELGLLYGFGVKRTFGFASMSTGISYVGLKIYENGKEIRHASVGLPIEIQLFLTANKIGVGIYGFANINSKSSFAGALICIQLGRLR